MAPCSNNNRPLGNQGAELQPLIQVCYAKAIRRLRSPYNARHAMPIGIGLHRINSGFRRSAGPGRGWLKAGRSMRARSVAMAGHQNRS